MLLTLIIRKYTAADHDIFIENVKGVITLYAFMPVVHFTLIIYSVYTLIYTE